ncbi:hypothetical protein QAD02_014892 [Eretmocerus hayati]|uniref:Uncharacterized protein n=1 Tax=Eretmocerus hayati TaxID=131215 RepID=A0ACC2P6A0_9HYME|nr:hypothetical protein QAD02_014892 [Eretmocerus hayati]
MIFIETDTPSDWVDTKNAKKLVTTYSYSCNMEQGVLPNSAANIFREFKPSRVSCTSPGDSSSLTKLRNEMVLASNHSVVMYNNAEYMRVRAHERMNYIPTIVHVCHHHRHCHHRANRDALAVYTPPLANLTGELSSKLLTTPEIWRFSLDFGTCTPMLTFELKASNHLGLSETAELGIGRSQIQKWR